MIQAPGFYPATDYPTYDSWEAMRSSVACLFATTAAHARAAMTSPFGAGKPTKAKGLGELAHCAILEPDYLEKRFLVWTGEHRGKGRPGEQLFKAMEARALAEGKAIIEDRKDYDEALRLRDAVWRKPWARAVFGSAGFNEVSYVWEDADYGILCKARADRIVADLNGYTTIVEIKTAMDASPAGFRRAIENYGYHVQAAMQLDGLQALAPANRYLVWVVLEKGAPWEVALYEPEGYVSSENVGPLIAAGRERYKGALLQQLHCARENYWPGYANDPQPIGLPPWATGIPRSPEDRPSDARGGESDDIF